MADSENKKIVGFKRFSDLKGKPKMEEINPSQDVKPMTDSDRPANPNLPKKMIKKGEKFHSREEIVPKDNNFDVNTDNDDFENDIDMSDKKNEGKVETFGRLAKFPKNVKASKAFTFLENVKVPKKSIWYIMVEKQDNELQMVKYNYKEGVDLNKFVNELKTYYISKYRTNTKVCKLIESINTDGNDKYSRVYNIPLVEVDGKKLITIITEDLIKLLSK
jgi:hypothetical protein